jgi:outer membrane lipopolysaccharide assembly protein LptE/RlpB
LWSGKQTQCLPEKRSFLKKHYIGYILMLMFCLPGCGYHALNWESNPHSKAGRTVSIPVFANKTFKPNLESILANAVIDEFARRSGLRIAGSAEADMTLTGEVVSYTSTAISYSRSDTVTEYNAYMKLIATLRRNSTQQVLWKGELNWSQAFPANTNIAMQQNAEDAAIQEICRRLAQQLYLGIVQDF